ncbi:MAG TPA: UDP-N-acetylmuramoyl-L-alanine--D-glutamate ligase [Bacteroidales bacterium]|nr:UDP-N-acetylmuramoyl-L-alanine--D-glutamate ligase [Bacteroidales bacterium]MDD4236366.1 UDP-N-acetylmuramoyl-L-alanine--D-glutamate ligase [Bacteroidales bacterium]HRW20607.1 UDP-N-acetylmuramoyl-L-alanine--D-glutamate ligase [Bacteroidales bacterium]HXK81289.1 UDP-N-acetylmuramoyl-L-alanine--D-glutamate ligase [Bacteroidales bacterium]
MNKRIAILGAGESGVGAAILAQKKGFDVWVSEYGKIKPKYESMLESEKIKYENGKHSLDEILKASEVIKSPGISDNVPVIKAIKEKGIPIVSEIEFAARYTNAKLICITGSNGKTTTSLLTYHILKAGGLNVGLAGNVGDSFALQVANNDFQYYVLELSSFQLDGMFKFKADIAVLLNVTPDHLDRYEFKFENYLKSKFRITQNLSKNDHFIINTDDEATMAVIDNYDIEAQIHTISLEKKPKNSGAYLDKENILFVEQNKIKLTMSIQELALQGKHNAYNSMAAGIAAQVLQIRKETIRESLMDFKNVEHRLEPVIKVHGIEFINDSKATNVNSAWYALECVNGPVVWIVGGVDKGNDYSILQDLVKQKVKAIVCLGIDNKNIHKAFDGIVDNIVDTKSMAEAVKTAYYLGDKNDTVLLSPACASFDLFDNYEDRGNQFKQSVRNL